MNQCLSYCASASFNLLIYGLALTLLFCKRGKNLGLFTKSLLFVPLIEYVAILVIAAPQMFSEQQACALGVENE